MVDISAIGMVDNLARSGVLLVVGNIIVHHDNDMIIWNTMATDNLVGMTNISLVTVVEPTITACHQDYPQITILSIIGHTHYSLFAQCYFLNYFIPLALLEYHELIKLHLVLQGKQTK